MQQKENKDNEVTDSVPISSFNLFFKEQPSTSSRTPQSGTVILFYRNKLKLRASISYRNRRSDASVGVEYCTFLRHHVSHDMGAVESTMVLITLDMVCSSLWFVLNCYFDVIEFVVFCCLAICTVDMGCCSCLCFVLHCCYFDVFDFVDCFGLGTCTLNMECFSCLCFVLNCCLDIFQFVVFCNLRTCIINVGSFFCLCFVLHCYFDVYEFVHFCGLDSCTLDMGCCVLNCYFDNVEFGYYVYSLSFQSRSCQHLLSTNPFTVDLTMDGDVEANAGPRKRRSNFESTPPSKIMRNAIFDQQTSKRKLKKQQKALNREICIKNTMLNIENRMILTKKPLKSSMVKRIEHNRSGFKPDPLIQFKSMTSNQNLSTVMCFDLETYQDGHLYQNHDGQFLPSYEIINKKRKESANLLK
ncbi:hypothetical protein P9112_006550 [Eukaryota sp. TZLM1-RC]